MGKTTYELVQDFFHQQYPKGIRKQNRTPHTCLYDFLRTRRKYLHPHVYRFTHTCNHSYPPSACLLRLTISHINIATIHDPNVMKSLGKGSEVQTSRWKKQHHRAENSFKLQAPEPLICCTFVSRSCTLLLSPPKLGPPQVRTDPSSECLTGGLDFNVGWWSKNQPTPYNVTQR